MSSEKSASIGAMQVSEGERSFINDLLFDVVGDIGIPVILAWPRLIRPYQGARSQNCRVPVNISIGRYLLIVNATKPSNSGQGTGATPVARAQIVHEIGVSAEMQPRSDVGQPLRARYVRVPSGRLGPMGDKEHGNEGNDERNSPGWCSLGVENPRWLKDKGALPCGQFSCSVRYLSLRAVGMVPIRYALQSFVSWLSIIS